MRHKTAIRKLLETKVIKADSVEGHLKLLDEISSKYPEKQLAKEARFFKALSDPVRLRILKERELCACELEYISGLSQPTVSYHLKMLEGAGVLKRRTMGKWSLYSIADEKIIHLLEKVEDVL